MNWRWVAFIAVMCALAGGIAAWVLHAPVVDHWAAVHTGTINEAGPYYGFWSGFGSDLTELGIIGAIGTGVYQLFKKYNCHESRCWRVGTHEWPEASSMFVIVTIPITTVHAQPTS